MTHQKIYTVIRVFCPSETSLNVRGTDQVIVVPCYRFKSLTIFAALSLATLLTTLGMALRCMWNFDRGLKMVIVRSHLSREREARKKQQVRQQKHQQHQGEPGKTDPGLELRSVA